MPRTPDAPPFVPDWFAVPDTLVTPDVVLLPLGPEHNDRDYEAWTSSLEHIHSTPGFGGRWPYPMTLDENHGDLVGHAEDFAARRGFTYTVLDAAGDTHSPSTAEVVGCVYIYPAAPPPESTATDGTDERDAPDARVRSWVRVSRAELDVPLWRAVSAWLASDWPFRSVEYAPRAT